MAEERECRDETERGGLVGLMIKEGGRDRVQAEYCS